MRSLITGSTVNMLPSFRSHWIRSILSKWRRNIELSIENFTTTNSCQRSLVLFHFNALFTIAAFNLFLFNWPQEICVFLAARNLCFFNILWNTDWWTRTSGRPQWKTLVHTASQFRKNSWTECSQRRPTGPSRQSFMERLLFLRFALPRKRRCSL